MIVAEDRKQARAIMRFIRGLLHGTPMLKRQIIAETTESFTLKNRIQIEVHTASLPINQRLHHGCSAARRNFGMAF